MGFLAEFGLKTAIAAIKPQEFQNLTIKEHLFGHENELINLISKFRWDIDPKDVCMLGYRDGLLRRKFTVRRGINDINGLGQFFAVNEKEVDIIWSTDNCNKVHGSDLALYNSTAVQNKDVLYIFPPEIHRALPIHYVEEVRNYFKKIYPIKYFLYSEKFTDFPPITTKQILTYLTTIINFIVNLKV